MAERDSAEARPSQPKEAGCIPPAISPFVFCVDDAAQHNQYMTISVDPEAVRVVLPSCQVTVTTACLMVLSPR